VATYESNFSAISNIPDRGDAIMPGSGDALAIRRLGDSQSRTRDPRAFPQEEAPGAAASLREGLDATLTVTRLGITGRCCAWSSPPTLRSR